MTAWRQVSELSIGDEDLAGSRRSRGRGPRRRARWSGRRCCSLSGRAVVFRRGTKTWSASSDGPALRRAGTGVWRAGGPRRPTATGQGADDHAGSESLVGNLACDKAKEHGYPHELWTTRLLARHARERGPAAGHECFAHLVQARCARSSAKRTSSRTRCATTWNAVTPSSRRRWRRFCVSTARSRS